MILRLKKDEIEKILLWYEMLEENYGPGNMIVVEGRNLKNRLKEMMK